jgi:hypothetical protein
MARLEHPEPTPAEAAGEICSALNDPAVAAGFAAGQPPAHPGLASVIFSGAPNRVARLLRVLIDDETHGPAGPLCIDLTIEATLQPGLGWVVSRADVETVRVADAAVAVGDPNLAGRLNPQSLAAVPLETALARVAELLAKTSDST